MAKSNHRSEYSGPPIEHQPHKAPPELVQESAVICEAFLNRPSLRDVYRSIRRLFTYNDKLSVETTELAKLAGKKVEYDEEHDFLSRRDVSSSTRRDFRVMTQLGSHRLERYLESIYGEYPKLAAMIPTEVADYEQFINIFLEHPEKRVRLLEKMIDRENRFAPDSADDYFGRFLYEFYGTEEKKENTSELGLALEGQVDYLEAWNNLASWGFPHEHFEAIREEIPDIRLRLEEYSDNSRIVPVIIPRLPDVINQYTGELTMSGVHRTLSVITELLSSRFRLGFLLQGHADEIAARFRLHADRSFTPGLSISLLNIDQDDSYVAPRNISVRDMSPLNTTDFAGLMAFAYHTRGLADYGQETGNTQYLLAGFDVRLDENSSWHSALEIRYSGKATLSTAACGNNQLVSSLADALPADI